MGTLHECPVWEVVLTYLAGYDGWSHHDTGEFVEEQRHEAHERAALTLHQVRHRLLELCLEVSLADPRRDLVLLSRMTQRQEPVQILILRGRITRKGLLKRTVNFTIFVSGTVDDFDVMCKQHHRTACTEPIFKGYESGVIDSACKEV